MPFKSYGEGYVKNTFLGGSYRFNYAFNYTDHLGNTRLSYGMDAGNVFKILEENNYYPFGLNHKNYNMSQRTYNKTGGGTVDICSSCPTGYKYKFLGQERQDELGLNWDTFRYRNYDMAIGRFMGIDPITEKYMTISPFQFAHNNPVWKIELEGLEGLPTSGQDIINDEELTSAAMNLSLQGKLNQNNSVNVSQIRPQTHTVTATYDLEGREPIDLIGGINSAIDNVAGAIEDNAGNTRIGSNDRFYFENANGNVFEFNQHVTTSAVAEIGSDISKFTGPIGDVIDVVNLSTAVYHDGGIGSKTIETGANIAGGAMGAELGAWAGAELGAALFSWSGPGAILAGVVGGVIGGIVGGYYGGEAAESLVKEE